MIDEVYGRDDRFTLYFGLSGAGMALALLVNNRLIDRFGVRLMVRVAASGFVAVTASCLVVTLGADGVPAFELWFGWAVIANMMSMIMGPMSASLALEPMADKAGTASAILGVAQLGVGALLAALVDARIGDTVTPMIVGALLFGTLGLASLVLGLRSDPTVEPEPDEVEPHDAATTFPPV